MVDDKWQKVKEIFDTALNRPAEDRKSFVKEACGDDRTLLAEVESLLSSLDNAGGFMETPAAAEIADMIEMSGTTLGEGDRLGRYEIVRQIGVGGMGEVYLASDQKLNRQVAIKVLNERLSKDNANLQRFIREAKAASALNHPNILVIHEIGESQNTHFIVSEHIKGKTLREILNERSLDLREVLDTAVQVARALVAAHEANLVHRDIKPENIMIRPDGVVKVLDFGLAKLLEQENKSVPGLENATVQQNPTAIGMILGTVAYMSPEQARGEKVDARTDIFSLGIVLYEMLTGEQPFKGETINHTIVAILEKEPPPLSLLIDNYPPEIEEIIKKCLAKKRDARYSTADILLNDLKELKGELAFRSKLERTAGSTETGRAETQIQTANTAETEQRRSIAVLPFSNMSADQENEYFCDGLAEELLNALAKVEDLKVAARTSTFTFKNRNIEISEIGRALNVSTVLEGSVRKSGNKLRITVQLVSAADGFHLWSERYDREMKDIFDIQDEITLAVVDALKVKLLGEEKAAILKRYSDNAEAYELFLKGLYHSYKWTDASFIKSLEYFKKSLEKDPGFAPAYAKIADYYNFHSFVGGLSPNEIIGDWRAAAERALELDESLPEAHLAMANIYFYHERNWAKTEHEFLRAIGLNPNDPRAHMHYGLFLVSRERFDEAVAEVKKALSLDPLSVAVNFVAAQTNFYADRFEDTRELVRMMRELDPNAPQSFWQEGKLLLADGRYEEAVEALQTASALGDNQMALSMRGCAYGLAGRRDEALTILDQLFELREQKYAAAFNIARVYAGLGDRDKAFEWLEKALEERNAELVHLKRKAEVGEGLYLGEDFTSDLRYSEILRRAGLPTPEIPAVEATGETARAWTATVSPTATNDKGTAATVNASKDQTSLSDGSKSKPKRRLFRTLALIVFTAGFIGLASYFFYAEKSVSDIDKKKSIAVLPFKPLSADSRDEALEMGMAETLITRLSNLKQVVVRPMSAVRKYTDPQQDSIKAGQDLQTEVVLDGSIQKAGDRVRVTVRLIDTRDGTSLWAEQFDDNFTDIFKMQDSIAERITKALAIRLSGREKEQLVKHYTDNPEAYQLYLQGEYLWLNKRIDNWPEQGLTYYQRALEKDPNFALAYIGIADYYIRLSGNGKLGGREAESNARANIAKALEIDDTLAEAHNALAELKYQYEYDWAGAEKDFKKAIELNPNVAAIRLAYGWFLMSAARFDEAGVEMDKAREFDPSSLTANVAKGRLLYFSRHYDLALQHFQNIMAVEPNSFATHFSITQIYLQKQMYPEFFEAFIKQQVLIGTPPEQIEEFKTAFNVSGFSGLVRKVLDVLETRAKTNFVRPSSLAVLNTHLGQKDEAFALLERALDERDPFIVQLKIDPELDSLRDDPRFKDLLHRIGFLK